MIKWNTKFFDHAHVSKLGNFDIKFINNQKNLNFFMDAKDNGHMSKKFWSCFEYS